VKHLAAIAFALLSLGQYAPHTGYGPDDCQPSPDGRPWYVVRIPQEQRVRFRNPDGSCVQCSLSMAGVACNLPAAENLLWQSQYGPPIRGGSGPDRVKAYCDARRLPAWNVSGPDSMRWVEWALRNGRPCGILWGSNHMITAVGYSGNTLDEHSMIAVCDNNSPQRIDWYSYADFRKRHNAWGGGWVVIFQTPPPPGKAPLVAWWDTESEESRQ
jgi:hypothetical protein